MATIGNLAANLTLESASFTRNMQKAERSLTSGTSRMNRALVVFQRKATSSFGRAAKSMLSLRGAIGLLAGGGGMALLVKRSLDTADSIAKVSDATGIGTTAIQQYRGALDLAGVAQEQTDKALKKFVRNMGELAKTSSETQSTLKDLDPALLKNLRSLEAVEDQLKLGFRALASYTSQQKRAAVAAALFGRAGGDMAVAVKDGAAAFEEAQQRVLDLDNVLSVKLLNTAVDTKDQLAELTEQINVNATRIGVALAPAIVILTGRFAELTSGIVKAGEALESAFAPSAQEQLDSLKARLVALQAAGEAVASIGRPDRRGGTTVGAVEATGPRGALGRERLISAPVSPEEVLKRQIAALEEIIALKKTAAETPTVALPDDPLAFIPKAKDLDAAFAFTKRRAKEEEKAAAAAQRNLDMIFQTVASNEERYLSELAFIKQTRAELEATNQLNEKNLAVLDRGRAEALERFKLAEKSTPLLQRRLELLGAVATETERLAEFEKKLNKAVADGVLTRVEANEVLSRTKDRMIETSFEMQAVESGLDRMTDSLVRGTASWEELGNVALSVLQNILSNALKTEDGLNSLFSSSGSSGGFFSSILSAIIGGGGGGPSAGSGAGLQGGFGGGSSFGVFGHGGRIGAGEIGIVGDTGPEFFKPDVAGTIIPAGELGGGGRFEGSPVFVDARAANNESIAALFRGMRELQADMPKIAVAAVQNARRRDPRLFR